MSWADTITQLFVTHFSTDPRVLAIWLGGSLARDDADSRSDIDLYLAVKDNVFEAFAAELPSRIAAVQPVAFSAEFEMLRADAMERVWFFHFFDLPIHCKLDCHIHPLCALSGVDPRVREVQRRELVVGSRRVLHDPEGVLRNRPAAVSIPAEELQRHAAEKLDQTTSEFVLVSSAIARKDFWLSAFLLSKLYRELMYLLAFDVDPQIMGDNYLKRLASTVSAHHRIALSAISFGPTPQSLATAALDLFTHFADVADRLQRRNALTSTAAFLRTLRAEFEVLCGRDEEGA